MNGGAHGAVNWRQYLRFLLAVAVGLGACVYAFIVILDPYQNVPFSPPWPRAPISQNQRFAYPAIARDARFDGLILGTSTARLIDPTALALPDGARIANLAMNSATAYEQQALHRIFVRHHPAMKYFVLGVDETWCSRAEQVERFTFRMFPQWMYDDDPYNDLLYLFNDKALENAVRMLELLVGAREPRYREDGYGDFTADFGLWDAATVRVRLYGDADDEVPDAAVEPDDEHPARRFPVQGGLAAMIDTTPRSARIVLLMPPLHARYIAARAADLAACKGRLVSLAKADRRVQVIDYMYVSNLTRDDRNYWDPVHFTRQLSSLVEIDLGRVLRGEAPVSPYVRSYGANPAPDP